MELSESEVLMLQDNYKALQNVLATNCNILVELLGHGKDDDFIIDERKVLNQIESIIRAIERRLAQIDTVEETKILRMMMRVESKLSSLGRDFPERPSKMQLIDDLIERNFQQAKLQINQLKSLCDKALKAKPLTKAELNEPDSIWYDIYECAISHTEHVYSSKFFHFPSAIKWAGVRDEFTAIFAFAQSPNTAKGEENLKTQYPSIVDDPTDRKNFLDSIISSDTKFYASYLIACSLQNTSENAAEFARSNEIQILPGSLVRQLNRALSKHKQAET